MQLADLLGPDLCAKVERFDDPRLVVITPLRLVKGPGEIEAGVRRRAGLKT